MYVQFHSRSAWEHHKKAGKVLISASLHTSYQERDYLYGVTRVVDLSTRTTSDFWNDTPAPGALEAWKKAIRTHYIRRGAGKTVNPRSRRVKV